MCKVRSWMSLKVERGEHRVDSQRDRGFVQGSQSKLSVPFGWIGDKGHSTDGSFCSRDIHDNGPRHQPHLGSSESTGFVCHPVCDLACGVVQSQGSRIRSVSSSVRYGDDKLMLVYRCTRYTNPRAQVQHARQPTPGNSSRGRTSRQATAQHVDLDRRALQFPSHLVSVNL